MNKRTACIQWHGMKTIARIHSHSTQHTRRNTATVLCVERHCSAGVQLGGHLPFPGRHRAGAGGWVPGECHGDCGPTSTKGNDGCGK